LAAWSRTTTCDIITRCSEKRTSIRKYLELNNQIQPGKKALRTGERVVSSCPQIMKKKKERGRARGRGGIGRGRGYRAKPSKASWPRGNPAGPISKGVSRKLNPRKERLVSTVGQETSDK